VPRLELRLAGEPGLTLLQQLVHRVAGVRRGRCGGVCAECLEIA
jgi:hypothetical protein